MRLIGFLRTRRRRATQDDFARLPAIFRRDRRGTTAVEFAIVAMIYVFMLLFAIDGGVFYIGTTVLDLATEQASRAIMINQGANNAGGSTAAPTTAAAFTQLVQSNSYNVLTLGNIQVAVQMAGPVTGTVRAAGTGFQAIPPVAIPAGTYQYLPGACTINYSTSTTAGTTTYSLSSSAGCTAGTCTTAKFSLLPASGQVTGGTDVSSTSGSTITNTYTAATFSCSAGQDIVVQAQYTDTTLSKIVAYLFGPITSTIAFQVEPATT
jgi:Flp pilus assembly protein TadG